MAAASLHVINHCQARTTGCIGMYCYKAVFTVPRVTVVTVSHFVSLQCPKNALSHKTEIYDLSLAGVCLWLTTRAFWGRSRSMTCLWAAQWMRLCAWSRPSSSLTNTEKVSKITTYFQCFGTSEFKVCNASHVKTRFRWDRFSSLHFKLTKRVQSHCTHDPVLLVYPAGYYVDCVLKLSSLSDVCRWTLSLLCLRTVCPAGWKPGSDTIIPDVQKSKAFFSKQ